MCVSQLSRRLVKLDPLGEINLVAWDFDAAIQSFHQEVVNNLWLEPPFVTRSVAVTPYCELSNDTAL